MDCVCEHRVPTTRPASRLASGGKARSALGRQIGAQAPDLARQLLRFVEQLCQPAVAVCQSFRRLRGAARASETRSPFENPSW